MRQEKEEGNEPLLISQPQVDDPHHSRQQQQSNCFDLISRPWLESKKVWKIAGPSIFGRLSMFSLTFITQPFAGHLGDLKLSAISISVHYHRHHFWLLVVGRVQRGLSRDIGVIVARQTAEVMGSDTVMCQKVVGRVQRGRTYSASEEGFCYLVASFEDFHLLHLPQMGGLPLCLSGRASPQVGGLPSCLSGRASPQVGGLPSCLSGRASPQVGGLPFVPLWEGFASGGRTTVCASLGGLRLRWEDYRCASLGGLCDLGLVFVICLQRGLVNDVLPVERAYVNGSLRKGLSPKKGLVIGLPPQRAYVNGLPPERACASRKGLVIDVLPVERAYVNGCLRKGLSPKKGLVIGLPPQRAYVNGLPPERACACRKGLAYVNGCLRKGLSPKKGLVIGLPPQRAYVNGLPPERACACRKDLAYVNGCLQKGLSPKKGLVIGLPPQRAYVNGLPPERACACRKDLFCSGKYPLKKRVGYVCASTKGLRGCVPREEDYMGACSPREEGLTCVPREEGLMYVFLEKRNTWVRVHLKKRDRVCVPREEDYVCASSPREEGWCMCSSRRGLRVCEPREENYVGACSPREEGWCMCSSRRGLRVCEPREENYVGACSPQEEGWCMCSSRRGLRVCEFTLRRGMVKRASTRGCLEKKTWCVSASGRGLQCVDASRRGLGVMPQEEGFVCECASGRGFRMRVYLEKRASVYMCASGRGLNE
ncbi:hypothetical protein LguiB_030855 [Lonicera macranthoides]